MNFQSLISFFTSPFGIVILVGTFSTLGRMFKSAQDQQAKKSALSEMRKAQRDSLRTGSNAQAAAPLQTMASKEVSLGQKQQTRQDRIEQLRAQRVEQLKKLRERRSASSSSQPAPAQMQARSTPVKRPPQRPAQTQARAAAQPTAQPAPQAKSQFSHQHQHGPFPKAYARPTPKPYAQPAAKPTRRKARPAQKPQRVSDESRRVSRSKPGSPIVYGSTSSKGKGSGAEARASFRKNIRQAIIAKEILGPPIGLRSPESTSM